MTTFSWRFDPLDLDPNNVEITADGVAFAKTSTLSNAQKLVKMLNDSAAQSARIETLEKALEGLIENLNGESDKTPQCGFDRGWNAAIQFAVKKIQAALLATRTTAGE